VGARDASTGIQNDHPTAMRRVGAATPLLRHKRHKLLLSKSSHHKLLPSPDPRDKVCHFSSPEPGQTSGKAQDT
jgi:hypothetical protein